MKLISCLCDKIEFYCERRRNTFEQRCTAAMYSSDKINFIFMRQDWNYCERRRNTFEQRCTAAMKLISFLCDKIEIYCERHRITFEQRCTAAMYSSDEINFIFMRQDWILLRETQKCIWTAMYSSDVQQRFIASTTACRRLYSTQTYVQQADVFTASRCIYSKQKYVSKQTRVTPVRSYL